MAETEQLLRETGIDVLGSVLWGTHVCLFYRTKEDLINVLVPYFKAGLENNEFCMWITSAPLDPTEAKSAMKKAMPDFDKCLKKGQIEIFPHDQWYLDRGIFDRERVIKGWMGKLNLALSNGYAGMRINGNTTWLDEGTWESFIKYEEQINETFDRFPIIVVCAYCLDKCGTSEIVNVANNHQLALIQKEGKWKLAKNAERKRAEKRAKEYQAQLKSLASELTLAEEHERHRLATKLHDQVSQSLALAKIKLDTLHSSVSSPPLAKTLEDVSASLEKAIQDTRSLTFDLSNPILYELGFEAAVAEWLSEQLRDKHGIATEFGDDGQSKPLDDDVRVLLFRNVRELLINVIKYANANRVRVSIRRTDDSIQVIVEDNGIGFDPTEVKSMAARRSEFGLLSIRERLEEMGGHLEIESKPGAGCKATMTAPLKGESRKKEG
ncbi:MAG: MEDS domain-containing protein [Sedimentisphaerales bacterium]|nr:MEDS domain-containing protein [Sedimentisphaerales bacterium]